MAELTPAQRARRARKNAKRKAARRLCAAGRALPPVVGLSLREFVAATGGTAAEYDAYADRIIAAARQARRRWMFPVEALPGRFFSLSKSRKPGRCGKEL